MQHLVLVYKITPFIRPSAKFESTLSNRHHRSGDAKDSFHLRLREDGAPPVYHPWRRRDRLETYHVILDNVVISAGGPTLISFKRFTI